MNEYVNSTDRNSEIVAFYYIIFGNRIHHGMSPADARQEACDAVTLRYGISRGRMLNIISERKYSRRVNDSLLKQKCLSLIQELNTVNEGLGSLMGRNDKLISLLKECVEDDK